MVEINIIQNTQTGNCFNIFLNALKIQFPEFAMYQNQKFYFTEDVDVQDWVDDYTCAKGEELLNINLPNTEMTTIIRAVDPTIYENLDKNIIWLNSSTGEIFTCIDSTQDKNIWVGTKSGKIIRPVPNADKFDFFSDSSTLYFSKLDGSAKDIGGVYKPKEKNIVYKKGVENLCASSERNGNIQIKDLDIQDSATIASWLKWNGNNGVMPYGFNTYDIYTLNGILGFNTANGDVTGIDFREYKNKWVYAISVFKNNELGDLYINGIKQDLNKIYRSFNSGNAKVSSKFTIFGWNKGTSYRKFGEIDRLKIINKILTEQEAQELSQAELDYINSIKE
jgi:hypothetical protein